MQTAQGVKPLIFQIYFQPFSACIAYDADTIQVRLATEETITCCGVDHLAH